MHPLSAFAFAFTHSPLSHEMLGDSPSPSVPAVVTGQVHLLFPSIPFDRQPAAVIIRTSLLCPWSDSTHMLQETLNAF